MSVIRRDFCALFNLYPNPQMTPIHADGKKIDVEALVPRACRRQAVGTTVLDQVQVINLRSICVNLRIIRPILLSLISRGRKPDYPRP